MSTDPQRPDQVVGAVDTVDITKSDLQVRIALEEESILLLQQFEIVKLRFENGLEQVARSRPLAFSLAEGNFVVAPDDDRDHPIMRARWVFLGQVQFDRRTHQYTLIWPWTLVGEDPAGFRTVLEKLPDDMKKILDGASVVFSDYMVVYYLQAFAAREMNLEYVKMIACGEDGFSMFGLTEVEWVLYVEPTPGESPAL
jgi:hypothetical protein